MFLRAKFKFANTATKHTLLLFFRLLPCDYGTLTLLVVPVEALVGVVAYRYRCASVVGCAIDPCFSLLVVQVKGLVEVASYIFVYFAG